MSFLEDAEMEKVCGGLLDWTWVEGKDGNHDDNHYEGRMDGRLLARAWGKRWAIYNRKGREIDAGCHDDFEEPMLNARNALMLNVLLKNLK